MSKSRPRLQLVQSFASESHKITVCVRSETCIVAAGDERTAPASYLWRRWLAESFSSQLIHLKPGNQLAYASQCSPARAARHTSVAGADHGPLTAGAVAGTNKAPAAPQLGFSTTGDNAGGGKRHKARMNNTFSVRHASRTKGSKKQLRNDQGKRASSALSLTCQERMGSRSLGQTGSDLMMYKTCRETQCPLSST